MRVFMHPQFIADLQSSWGKNFAHNVLKKVLYKNGKFKGRPQTDHELQNVEIDKDQGIWKIFRVDRRRRVLYYYMKENEDIYLVRAGEHDIERNFTPPNHRSFSSAVEVLENQENLYNIRHDLSMLFDGYLSDRFWKNKDEAIYTRLLSRKLLPHKDIWLLSPCIDQELFRPDAPFGDMLEKQIQSYGARVKIMASEFESNEASLDQMERFDRIGVKFFECPCLHTKLYCFLLDRTKLNQHQYLEENCSSLILLGSANLTQVSLKHNEELCYTVPETAINYITEYVEELTKKSNNPLGAPDVRAKTPNQNKQ